MTTNPHRSRLMSSGSHWVRGSAPISTNTAAAGTVSVTPDSWSRKVRLSRRPVPAPPVTTALCRTAMLGVLVISLTRYSDMLSASDWPRTSIVTLAAYVARWTAACPAEFAPPTTNTSRSFIAWASEVAAP